MNMSLYEIASLIALGGGCLCVGFCSGIIWERKNTNSEWQRWLSLSERVDSLSGSWEHDMFVLEDRLGRIEDNLIWTQKQCLHFDSEGYEDEEITQDIPIVNPGQVDSN